MSDYTPTLLAAMSPRERQYAELDMAGVPPTEIATTLGISATNAYGLKRQIRVRSERLEHTTSAPGRDPVLSAVDKILADAVARNVFGVGVVLHIAWAVECTILHRRQHDSRACLHGLQLLGLHPDVRHQVQQTLWDAKLEGHAQHVDRVIKKAGYIIVGDTWRAPVSAYPQDSVEPRGAATLQPPPPMKEEPMMSLPVASSRRVEFVDETTIPTSRYNTAERTARLAEARGHIREALQRKQAIKLTLEPAERSHTTGKLYHEAAHQLGMKASISGAGKREYTGQHGKMMRDHAVLYVRILATARVDAKAS